MKQTFKTNLPLWLCAGLGLVTAGLRFGLYAACLDEKNLIVGGHPLELLVWVVTAAALVLLTLLVLPLQGACSWEDNFRAGIPGGVGSLALAAGIAASVLTHWQEACAMPELLQNALGALSAAGMVWVAVCRFRGKKPAFVCHSLVCLYFCVYLLGQYRIWSGNPQLQDYVFFLLACVCMGLFSYQQAAFEVGLGNRRKLLLPGLAGGFFGIAALYGAYDLPLCVGGAVWMLTNLCALTPPARYLK